MQKEPKIEFNDLNHQDFKPPTKETTPPKRDHSGGDGPSYPPPSLMALLLIIALSIGAAIGYYFGETMGEKDASINHEELRQQLSAEYFQQFNKNLQDLNKTVDDSQKSYEKKLSAIEKDGNKRLQTIQRVLGSVDQLKRDHLKLDEMATLNEQLKSNLNNMNENISELKRTLTTIHEKQKLDWATLQDLASKLDIMSKKDLRDDLGRIERNLEKKLDALKSSCEHPSSKPTTTLNSPGKP